MLSRKVGQYIAERQLLGHDAGVLVALSGGADSVALLCVLLELGFRVEAAHCNFHLRGAESDRDEAFCRQLCEARKVPLHIAHFDTHAYADLHGVSIEMAARDLRYNYFAQLLGDLSLEAVCVAHHKDDSVETVILNLLRGTGIDGLKGIVPKNGRIVRPLLCADRDEILAYLGDMGQDFVTDSTNMEDNVQRNKVRLNVIPLLKQINPAACRNIAKAAERIADIMPLIDGALSDAQKRVCYVSEDLTSIDISKLQAEASPETVLWNILKDKGFSPSQVELIASNPDARTGSEWRSSTHSLVVDRGVILVEPLSCGKPKSMRIPETGTYIYDERHKFSIVLIAVDDGFVVSKDADCVCLDADKAAFPLTVRPVRNGDTFVPFGMRGRKLLSDFLTDRKIPLLEKRRQLVVTDREDRILWVAGIRPDNRFCITPSTRRALVIRMVCSSSPKTHF